MNPSAGEQGTRHRTDLKGAFTNFEKGDKKDEISFSLIFTTCLLSDEFISITMYFT